MSSPWFLAPRGWVGGLVLASALAGLPPTSAADPKRDARLVPLARLAQDPAPRTRLEALRSLAKIPTAKSAEIALSVLDQPMDPALDYALWLTINDLSEPWIAALESGAWSPVGREKQLEFALKAIRPEQASRVLARSLARQPLTRDGQGPWIELIGSAGSPAELRALLDKVLQGGFDDPATARALRALGEAHRLRKVQPPGDLTEVGRLLERPSASVQVEALRLAAQWRQLGAHFPKLGQLAGGADVPANVRSEAFNTLRAIGGAGALETVAGLAGPTQPASTRMLAVAALAALDLGQAVPRIVELARGLKEADPGPEFWRSVLAVKGAAKALAAALPAGSLDPAVARSAMRIAREGGRADLELVAALSKAGGLSNDTQAFNAQWIQELATKAARQGDPVRGELVYRRAELACTSCHAIGGAGGRVGPDLTSIGASAPADYLVESLILPDAKIKEGYHSVEITTKDGSEYVGTLARESQQELILRNAAGAEQAIAKNDIAKREQGTRSLMPSGLLESLDERDQADLFAFLSRLGKPGDFDASKGGVARRWHFANLVHTDVQNGDGDWAWKKPLTDPRWKVLFSRVNGQVTRQIVEEAVRASTWTGKLAIYAATEVQVPAGGKVRFQLDCPPGPELWIDGRKVGGVGPSTAELPAGRHRVVLQIPPQHVPEALRLTSPDAAFVVN